MPLKIVKNKSSVFITLFLILALLTGLTAGYFSAHGITENGKFEAFSRKVFQNEVSGSTLTLHYTLAHPEKQGIRRKKASLGTVPTDMKNTYQICSQYETKLKFFRYHCRPEIFPCGNRGAWSPASADFPWKGGCSGRISAFFRTGDERS